MVILYIYSYIHIVIYIVSLNWWLMSVRPPGLTEKHRSCCFPSATNWNSSFQENCHLPEHFYLLCIFFYSSSHSRTRMRCNSAVDCRLYSARNRLWLQEWGKKLHNCVKNREKYWRMATLGGKLGAAMKFRGQIRLVGNYAKPFRSKDFMDGVGWKWTSKCLSNMTQDIWRQGMAPWMTISVSLQWGSPTFSKVPCVWTRVLKKSKELVINILKKEKKKKKLEVG